MLSLRALRLPPEAVGYVQEDDLSRWEGSTAGEEEGGASFSRLEPTDLLELQV